jgi:hypothetical protein
MDSFIEVELYQDKPFVAGEVLYGTVHLYCKTNIPDVKQVSLTFHGEEQVIVNLPETKGGPPKPLLKQYPILTEKTVLFSYEDYNNVILQGSYSYPFSLYLPQWLPQSHLCFNTPDLKKP